VTDAETGRSVTVTINDDRSRGGSSTSPEAFGPPAGQGVSTSRSPGAGRPPAPEPGRSASSRPATASAPVAGQHSLIDRTSRGIVADAGVGAQSRWSRQQGSAADPRSPCRGRGARRGVRSRPCRLGGGDCWPPRVRTLHADAMKPTGDRSSATTTGRSAPTSAQHRRASC
jgi:hypothetical protein